MARIKRIVIPDTPHHVTQRGVRSMNMKKSYFLNNLKSIDYKNFLFKDTKIKIINEKTRIGKPCGDESFYDWQITNCRQSVVTDKLKNIV